MVIFKYKLERNWKSIPIDQMTEPAREYQSYERISVLMNNVNKILCIKYDSRGEIYVWAFVDKSSKLERHDFLILGTGQEIFATEETYITTIFDNRNYYDPLVWHIFYLGKIDQK